MKLLLIAIICISVLEIGCNDQNTAKEEVNKTEEKATNQSNTVQLSGQQIQNAGIVIDSVQLREMHKTLKVNGVIDVAPQNIISVTFPLGGYITTMNMLPGLQVKKGQVLAVLEDPQYVQLQQDYLIAKSKLKFLETDFERQKELNQTKANSDKVFQQARTEYESQKVLVRSLFEKLALIKINANNLRESNISRRAYIYAPISGYLSKVNVNKGRYVNPTDVLFELINPADLHLNLTVFERDVLNLAIGQTVSCYSNNNPEKYTATISVINRNINEDRSSEVHCHFHKYHKNLTPGLFMNAEIELTDNKVKALPAEAIVRWENKHYVFTADNDSTFSMVQVEPGTSFNGFTEIKEPTPNGKLVTKNAYTILMKLKNSGEE